MHGCSTSTPSNNHLSPQKAKDDDTSPAFEETILNNILLTDFKSDFDYFTSTSAPSPPAYRFEVNDDLQHSNPEVEPIEALPEARFNVPNKDDPTMPCNTFRMWFLGMVFSTTVTFLNQLYSFRDARLSISFLVVALLCLPLGHLMARILPQRELTVCLGSWKRKKQSVSQQQHQQQGQSRPRSMRLKPGQHYQKRLLFRFSLNPGPFSIKEHALIISMVQCAITYNSGVQIMFLEESVFSVRKSFWAALGLCTTIQMAGFGVAGGLRRFLVQPAQMVWPQTLAIAVMIRSLHSRRSVEIMEMDKNTIERQQQHQQSQSQNQRRKQRQGQQGQEGQQASQTPTTRKMSRMRYFWWICLGSFVYHIVPSYIFPTLESLSILCWIAPGNLVLSQITGSQGLGIGTVSLSWTSIANLAPLLTPWWVQANMLAGLILFPYLTVALGYYSDVLGARSYPIMSTRLFTENGSQYNINHVMYYQNWTLNEQAYKDYGPVRMPLSLIMTYFFQFAIPAATITHTIMYHGSDLRQLYRTGLLGPEDVHTRMMRAYPEVPDLWYQILVGVMVVITVITCEIHNYMPWWATLLAFALTIVLVLPAGIIAALTNQVPDLALLSSCFIGYLQPGHFITASVFRSYGTSLTSQTFTFLSGLKLGHYLKVPPQTMFMAQTVGGLLGAVVNVTTYRWMLEVNPDICLENLYSCPGAVMQQISAFMWGTIGPKRIFGGWDVGGYRFIQLGFLIGAALPILTWYLSKKILPKWFGSRLDLIHWPVIMSPGILMIINYPYAVANSIFIGFIFMFVLRRYRFEWWSRYAFLTSVAMDTGVALSSLFIFIAFQMTGVEFPEWWGNPSDWSTVDHCPLDGVSARPPLPLPTFAK